MLKLYSIISGSSGNCSLITDGKTNILIDCGTSGKRATDALAKIGINDKTLNAIVVTHEHTDHTKGVGVLSRRLSLPVYATSGTHEHQSLSGINESLVKKITTDVTFEIGSIEVTPFAIPHDANEPCGYVFVAGGERVAIATDIGAMSDRLFSRLAGCQSVLLESNHDVDMLKFGDYPYALKQRILSDVGHLSNKAAAAAALELVKNGTKHIMLGHLSDKNNTPDIAQMVTYCHLAENGISVGDDVTLQVAERYKITEFING